MKKIAFLAVIFWTNGAFSQWTMSRINENENHNNVSLLSNKIAFMDSYGKIMKTSDGGLTWSTVYSDAGSTIVDLFFINGKTGYFNVEKGTSTFLKKTKDGGKTWSSSAAPASGKIYFTNPSTQILATFGHDGGVFKSTDGGITFGNQKTHSHGHSIGDIFFVTPNEGYLTGWFPDGYIIKTMDGGETWMHVNVPKGDFLDVYFPSLNVGYTTGLFGKVWKTTDRGTTWTELNTGLSAQITLYAIACSNENTCYAVGDEGTIIKTIDGGLNWKVQKTGTKVKLNDISIKGKTCLVVGDAGVVLKSKIN
jgi:photosystem II stability/assembly factor-like uncharacterized protein